MTGTRLVALDPLAPTPVAAVFDRVIGKPVSAMSEIEVRRLVADLRVSTSTLQSLVDSRTAELRASEERQRVLLTRNALC